MCTCIAFLAITSSVGIGLGVGLGVGLNCPKSLDFVSSNINKNLKQWNNYVWIQPTPTPTPTPTAILVTHTVVVMAVHIQHAVGKGFEEIPCLINRTEFCSMLIGRE
ncbi:unnamed protein product [Rotaria socialis]|uniref:Uncharacterized protein n=2 Tax=Rotaria socialis TaxID=392032 RepID=A0A820XZ50_9BILA|nr:unnamed protein product [Rotaria socialis]CAF4351080.1 unnamed protein product [Rotaria socialis]CAF4539847.1 unnamed protein product [Rotaria socialis]